jgi:mannose/cellobiose epimerase-like protein (N-acyl-D-glucosamine 2-epimerase family)
MQAKPTSHGSSAGWRDLPSHRQWLARETSRLLEFARGSQVERGFGWLDDHGVPDLGRPTQLWITSRMTHIFALGDLLGHPGCGPLADHGLRAIRDVFEDRDCGGWFAEDPAGTSPAAGKEAYAHSFVLLAAASGAIAGREPASGLLDEAMAVLTRRFWSEDERAVLEGWDRRWEQTEPYRGANANMHMVEAFIATGDALREAVWHGRALRIAERLIGREAGAREWRVPEHFTADWTFLPDYNEDRPRDPFRPYGVTPGHGLEWSRLLCHLHESLTEPPAWLLDAARGLFARAVADGWDGRRGGFAYTTGFDGRPVVAERFHWVVCEAIAAAAALHALTGEQPYARWFATFCDYADSRFVDRERGSWRHELDPDGRPSSGTWHGKPDVYHALQAALLPAAPLTPALAWALAAQRPGGGGSSGQ